MAQNELEKKLVGGMEVMPDFLKDEKSAGLEHVTKDDTQMPRLALAQQMSPEVNPGNAKYMEDLKSGDMFNSLTGQIYGRGPLTFTVLRADPPRWVEFIPREQGGGVKDPNVPFGDPRTAFQPGGRPPIATKFYDFIIMLLPSRELVALSFKSTGLKIARQLNGLMQARQKPIYAGNYLLQSVPTQNARGSFFIYGVRNAIPAWATVVEDYKQREEIFHALRGKVIEIDRGEHDSDIPSNGDDGTSFDPAELERQANQSGM
jgi:hypothetical protein